MTLVPSLVAALILLAPPGAPASGTEPASPGGWRGARFGMSPEAVLAAFPGEATRISPEVKLADGNVIAVGIDGYAFEGLALDVRFVFEGGKLALVSLRNPEKKPVDEKAYLRLREALTKRWGAPLEETKDDAFIDMRQTRWNRGPDRADLKYIPGVVVMIFYPRPAAP